MVALLPTENREATPLWTHQAQALDFISDKPGAMLAMQMGTGKDLDNDTPVATPQGWTTMGELRPGDQVFDEQGNPCNVIAAFPQGIKPVYNVEFDDGTVLAAGKDHQWVTLTHSDRYMIHVGARDKEHWSNGLLPITTEEIKHSLVHRRGTLKESNHSIPTAKPLHAEEKPLPIEPYILGSRLGDVSSGEAAITCHQTDQPHYASAASEAGENWRLRNARDQVLTVTLAGDPEPRFRTRLNTLQIFNNKHIPPQYLQASRAQRLALLQGLMDTDGHAAKQGEVEFTSTSKQLAEGVLELALSLGQKATASEGKATLNGLDVSTKYRVRFTPTLNVFRLPRKAQHLQKQLERRKSALTRQEQRYIRRVTPAGHRQTTCIAVDSPSSLFLAGRQMVPTHNTRVAIEHIHRINAKNILIMAPLAVVDHVWEDQINLHTDRPLKVISLGNRYKDSSRKIRQAVQTRAGTNPNTPLAYVFNYESAITKPFQEWARKQKFDLVILDECHPGHTLVSTPKGEIPIGQLNAGDPVWGIDHHSGRLVQTQVLHTFRRTTDEEIIQIGDTQMTPNHPIWTARGYIPAKDVKHDDTVARISQTHQEQDPPSHLQTLRDSILGGLQKAEVLQSLMRSEALHEPAGAEGGPQSLDAGNQAEARSPRKNPPTPGIRLEPAQGPVKPGQIHDRQPQEGIRPSQRGQRQNANNTPADHQPSHRLDNGVQRSGQSPDADLPHTLQNRRGGTGTQDSRRDRRPVAHVGQGEGQGRQENGVPPISGLDRSPLPEQGSTPTNGPSPERDLGSRTVFNIETGTGNYFAEGLLVHNCHKIKNPEGKISAVITSICDRTPRRLALTGTPMPHSPLDIFAQYRAVQPAVFGDSYHRFRHRYAVLSLKQVPHHKDRTKRKTVYEVAGFQNRAELEDKFRSIAFQVNSDDVLDLPPYMKNWQRVMMTPHGRRAYDQMEETFKAELNSGAVSTANNAFSHLLRLQQITSGFMTDANTGEDVFVDDSKERALTEVISNIADTEPVVVFARFLNDLKAIKRAAEANERPAFEHSGQVKQLAQWQSQGGVIAMQIQAGGVGVDLTQACYCIYYSMGFSLGDYEQSMYRLHRPGQTRPQHYLHLIASDTIDEKVVRSLGRKQHVIDDILHSRNLRF